jgi:hypothetical protein
MKMDNIKLKIDKIEIILKLLKLTFLKISSSSLSKSFINRNCVEIKNIKGNVSYTIEGELRIVKKKGNSRLVSASFK